MQDNQALAAYIGIAASAAIYLAIGALLGSEWPDLLSKVMYGVGMCVTARWLAGRVYPRLGRGERPDAS